MEYIYAALLLHKLGKSVNEESINKILQASGSEIDEGKIKSLVASLKDVDIDAELEKAVVTNATPFTDSKAENVKQEEAPKEEEKKEASAAGLSSLFG